MTSSGEWALNHWHHDHPSTSTKSRRGSGQIVKKISSCLDNLKKLDDQEALSY